MDRNDSSAVLRSAAGGQMPAIGDTLEFTQYGWRFRPNWPSEYLGLLAADPSAPVNGQFWYNTVENKIRIKTAGGVYQSAAFTLVP